MMKKSMTKTNHKKTKPHKRIHSHPHQKKAKPHFRPIDLTKDTVFQYFFTKHKSCLISLLHTFLPLPEERKITSLNILDPKLHPSSGNLAEKNSICDLKLTLNTGEKVNVEMQNFPEKHFFKRTLFYLSRLYTEGLKQGGNYDDLPDTYLLILTNFILFKQAGAYYSSFSFRRDQAPHFMFHRALRVVTVELCKFPEKRISALLDLKEQWCYMLRRSFRMGREELNRLGERSSDMKQVANHFLELSASEQDRLLEEHREKSRLVLHNQREYAREEFQRKIRKQIQQGMEEGRRKGMEAGVKQGMEAGVKQGMEAGVKQGMEAGRKQGMEAGVKQGMEAGVKQGMEAGVKQGMEAGRKQGMEAGVKQGMEAGRKQATEQNMKQVALQMLKEKADINFISRVTGITKKKVLKLKTETD